LPGMGSTTMPGTVFHFRHRSRAPRTLGAGSGLAVATDAIRSNNPLSPEQARLLTRVDLFAHLERVALARLAASAQALPVQPDDEVCRQGDPADGLYVVAEGTFGVYTTGLDGVQETRIAELRPGDHFGEMALLNDEPRSATVRADGQGAVLQLERARFEELM